MDIDNINDIEVLRDIAKKGRVKMACTVVCQKFTFEAEEYYLAANGFDCIEIYSEDLKCKARFRFEGADRIFYRVLRENYKYRKNDYIY